RRADGRPVRAVVRLSGAMERALVTNILGMADIEIEPKSSQVELWVRATELPAHGVVSCQTHLGGLLAATVTPLQVLPFVGLPWENPASCLEFLRLSCGEDSNDFLLRTDRAVYRGGDTVRLIALGGGRDPVFVDLLKDGQTVCAQTIAMIKGRGEASLDLPVELAGNLVLFAYRPIAQDQYLSKTRLLPVHAANQLNVRTVLDRSTYRPGGQARLRFTLTDRQGRPAPGALSLAGVDEAVFSVLDKNATAT